MERRQLEYFLAVVEHGGFTNAARVLHIAQPSLSHAVAALESELGGLLFHRVPHGTELTAAGTALVEPARQIARDLATASASVREVLELSAGRLDVVAQTTLAVEPLAPMVGRFLQTHPKVSVQVKDPERGSAVESIVRTGQCELGLVDAAIPTRALHGVDLAEQELRLVLPPGTARGKNGAVGIRELARYSFVATPAGTATRDILDDTVGQLGVVPSVAVETAHRAMIVPLVLAGAGVSVLPRSMAEEAADRGAMVIPTRPALRYRGRLVWRSGPLSPAASSFVEMTRRHYAAP